MKVKTIRQIIGGAGSVGAGTALGLGLESATAKSELKNAPKTVHRIDRFGTPYLEKSPQAKQRSKRKFLSSLGLSVALTPFGVKNVPRLIRSRAMAGIAKETKDFNAFANKSLTALKQTKADLNTTIVNAKKRGNTKDIREATKRLIMVNNDISKVESIINKRAPSLIRSTRQKSILGGGGASKRLKRSLADVFGSNKTMFGEKNIVSNRLNLDGDSMKKIYKMKLEKAFPRDLV